MSSRFLEVKDNIKWFIVKYFGESKFNELIKLAESEDNAKLSHELDSIWFLLPDTIFNIRENPTGWNDFLYVVEPS